MRLHINDMMAYEENGSTLIRRVLMNDKSTERVVLTDHLCAKTENTKPWTASANQLQLKNARKISVDILGRVHDPVRIAARKAAE
jgi:hypothetical protein